RPATSRQPACPAKAYARLPVSPLLSQYSGGRAGRLLHQPAERLLEAAGLGFDHAGRELDFPEAGAGDPGLAEVVPGSEGGTDGRVEILGETFHQLLELVLHVVDDGRRIGPAHLRLDHDGVAGADAEEPGVVEVALQIGQ